MSVVRSWKPCPAYSGSECPGKTPEQESEAISVFQTGLTGSTGCVLSFNPVIWSRMEKTQINADTLTSYEVECLLHLKDVQVTQICHYGTYHGG